MRARMRSLEVRRVLVRWVGITGVGLLLLGGTTVPAVEEPPRPHDGAKAERPTTRISVRPSDAPPLRIDGVVDEREWAGAAKIELRFEIDPGENVPPPVGTECLLAHDERNLYLAFRALDPDPAAIRAHLADRDKAYADDFVGIMVDTFNDERRGFEFFVNPFGAQMDLSRNDTGSGSSEDDTWDAIWDSAGRITPNGYEVEIAIPFASLRFERSAGEKTWSFIAFRSLPRNVRHQISSVPFDRNTNCFFCQAGKVVGFEGVTPGRSVELDPTVTASRSDVAAGDDGRDRLDRGSVDVDAGLSGRWGITPNLSLNGAVNPDFSQIEADAMQLQVNTRFALFYPEKRPFFLEGGDFFLSTLQAVYTRAIADPSWGLKLTGKEGKNAIGLFVVRDDTTNLLLPSNQGSSFARIDEPSDDLVLRYRRDVGASSTVGLLATNRQVDGYWNRLYGFDGNLRVTDTDTVRFQLLQSHTSYPEELARQIGKEAGAIDDPAMRLLLSHATRDWNGWVYYDDIGRDFRADLGFMPRVDTREVGAGIEKNWYGDANAFLTKSQLTVEGWRTEDHDGLLTDQAIIFRGWAYGPLQSIGTFDLRRTKEFWDGVTYDKDRVVLWFEIRPTGDLYPWIGWVYGDAVDYENSRPATITRFDPGLTLKVGRHLSLDVTDTFEKLDVDGGELYRANLLQLKAVWQFDVRSFVRAVVQWVDIRSNPELYLAPESVEERNRQLFTQLLFSYKLNPQTVLFVGYSDNRLGTDTIGLGQTDRTFFVKLGYAWLL